MSLTAIDAAGRTLLPSQTSKLRFEHLSSLGIFLFNREKKTISILVDMCKSTRDSFRIPEVSEYLFPHSLEVPHQEYLMDKGTSLSTEQ